MSDVYFYSELYNAGVRANLFKNSPDPKQNLQVADFYDAPGSPDIHLTYDKKSTNHKNLHLTVRFRGNYSDDVDKTNKININKGKYKKPKSDPALNFYLARSKASGKLVYIGGETISGCGVNIYGYIARLNELIEKEMK